MTGRPLPQDAHVCTDSGAITNQHSDRFWRDVQAQPAALQGLVDAYRSKDLRPLLKDFVELTGRATAPITLTGMGASLFACMYAKYGFDRYGITTRVEDTSYLADYGAASLKRDNLVVLVSQSGESIEAKKLTEHAAADCMKVVITNRPSSTVAKKADLVLPLLSPDDGSVALQTYVNTLGVLALLIVYAYDSDWTETVDDLSRIAGSLGTIIKEAADAAQPAADHLDRCHPTFLLGRGPCVASALEGALLLKETAKRPAEGFEAGSFRHGSVEVVDQTTACILTDCRGPTSSRNRRLAEELVGYGARALVISDDAAEWPEHQSLHLVEAPAVGEFLAPLAQTPYLQLLAHELARRSSIQPGSFRNTTPIIEHD
jgi:glutamine---fructose-6-phosphate transaminase (isomerizing)